MLDLSRRLGFWAVVLLVLGLSLPAMAHNGSIAVAAPVASITIDGDLSDWPAKAKSGRTRRWNAFLKGYSNVRTLGVHELEATSVFVAIRHIWLLGLHTQGAEGWGRGWMNDGYFDFHIKFIKRWIEFRKIL